MIFISFFVLCFLSVWSSCGFLYFFSVLFLIIVFCGVLYISASAPFDISSILYRSF